MVRALFGLIVFAATAAQAGPPLAPFVQCGCPSPRLLGQQPIDLSRDGLSAWLHHDARLVGLTRSAEGGPLVEADLPLSWSPIGNGALWRVEATAPLPSASFVGLLKKNERDARDVMRVTGGPGRPTSPAPVVSALWLNPLETRARRGCGEYLTHRLAVEQPAGAVPVEAWRVTHFREAVPGGKELQSGRSALLDARFAQLYGIGHVDACEQGLDLDAAPATVEIVPIGRDGTEGLAWRFSVAGAADPTRIDPPSTADVARLAEPFPMPGALVPPRVSDKTIAIAIMGAIVAVAGLAALLVFVVLPKRRRRVQDVCCPNCRTAVPVDLLVPQQGFFCPSCGGAGFFNGAFAVVTPKSPPAPDGSENTG